MIASQYQSSFTPRSVVAHDAVSIEDRLNIARKIEHIGHVRDGLNDARRAPQGRELRQLMRVQSPVCPKSNSLAIETNPARARQARSDGFRLLDDYSEAASREPFFWDICTSTESHVDIIEKIVGLSPTANILDEKPICPVSHLDRLRTVIGRFRGKIVVNENYGSSCVT